MLQDLRKLIGCKITATDGEIGRVKDFYFDDRTWMVRYLVADTGNWLTGRQVLLTPDAFGSQSFGKSEDDPESLHVNLSRQRIEDSPSIDAHRPVSRQNEEEYYRHYGWPMYWSADPTSGVGLGASMGAGAIAITTVDPAGSMGASAESRDRPVAHHDVHLRSIQEVVGYGIRATDDDIGKVAAFVVNERTWRIEEIAIETGNWFSGKEISVRANNIMRISYDESLVFVNLTKADIAATPRYERYDR